MNLPIIDAHLHVWDPNNIYYPWLEENALMNREYLLHDYNNACLGLNIEKMVFVQCECSTSQYMQELQWVTDLAREDARIKAIIPWAPLEDGEKVRPILDQMVKNPLVKGIRRIIEFEKEPDFCLQPSFVRGVQILADYCFSFDINIAHHQMENTIKLVQQCPETLFILDHAGKPDIRNHLFESWSGNIKELSKMSNVYCKVSGLVTEADREHWTVEDLKPYILHILECFGWDRVAFGGDWPVMTQAAEYVQWVKALYDVVKKEPEENLKKLFHDNVIRFYRLAD